MIDHSKASLAAIWITVDALVVRMVIQDYGMGIWKKLQEKCHLDDPRHAPLELTKGKLTTDPKRHTEEGIFFTSRMFDKFFLGSDKLTFCRFREGDEWLFDVKEDDSGSGTRVSRVIDRDSERTTKEIFDKFTADLDDYGFTRAQLSVTNDQASDEPRRTNNIANLNIYSKLQNIDYQERATSIDAPTLFR